MVALSLAVGIYIGVKTTKSFTCCGFGTRLNQLQLKTCQKHHCRRHAGTSEQQLSYSNWVTATELQQLSCSNWVTATELQQLSYSN